MTPRPLRHAIVAVLALAGCAEIIGFPDYTAATSASGSGGGTASASSGSGGAMTASSGGMVCTPGAMEACYDGPPETRGVGACADGQRTCSAAGDGYGPCMGGQLPATERCDTHGVDESCDGIATCTGRFLWARSFGDGNNQTVSAVAARSDGAVIVVGSAQGMVDFGGGTTAGGTDNDAFVAAYNAHGAYLWSHRLGDGAAQTGLAVAVDQAGNVIVAGEAAGSVDFGDGKPLAAAGPGSYVAKYDPSGKLVFASLLGDASGVTVHAVLADPSGAIVIGGEYQGTLSLPGCAAGITAQGMADAFVARLDSKGACQWLQGYGSDQADTVSYLALSAAGELYAAGTYGGAITIGPDTLANGGAEDAFVAKLDPTTGAGLWARFFTSAAADKPAGLAADPMAGDLVLVGTYSGAATYSGGALPFQGGIDSFYLRIDPTGNITLGLSIGTVGDDYAGAVAVDPLGNVTVAVNTNGSLKFAGATLTTTGGFDAFVVKLMAGGSALWDQRLGDPAYQAVFALATDTTGRIVAGGEQNGTIDPGGGPLTAQGGLAGFVVVYSP